MFKLRRSTATVRPKRRVSPTVSMAGSSVIAVLDRRCSRVARISQSRVKDLEDLLPRHARRLAGPDRLVKQPAHAVFGAGLGRGGAPFGDKQSLAALRIDEPFALQLVVCALHRIRVHLHFDSHRPQRGQHLAGPIEAGRHRRTDFVGDLQVDRHMTAGIDSHALPPECIRLLVHIGSISRGVRSWQVPFSRNFADHTLGASSNW